MAGFGNKVKLTMLKGMEAVGQRASSMASNAQLKLQELNLETQRREILSEFPLRAYDLWQKGETLPEPLAKMMENLSDLDERLGVLRAQRYAKVEAAQEEAAENAAEEATDGTETEEETPGEETQEDAAPVEAEQAPAIEAEAAEENQNGNETQPSEDGGETDETGGNA